MRAHRRMAVVALAGLLAGAMVVPAVAAPSARGGGPDEGVIPGQYIVTLVEGASPWAVADEHAREHGADIEHVYEFALLGYAAHMSEQAAAEVAQDPRVVAVEPDRVVSIAKPSGNPGGGGGEIEAVAQTLPFGIDRIDGELSSLFSAGPVNVDVAVIDTGIDYTHPDLDVRGGKNCSTGTTFKDGNGHGTHVAGTIGAKNDANGVVGVTPGARLWAVRVLNNAGSGSWSSVACGIDWVTANASTIEVANMSLGGGGSDGACSSSSLHQAICNSVNAGVTYAVAAGNSSSDAKDFVPAAYDEVITVSALADFDGKSGGNGSPTCRTDEDDTFANFSNYGADVDVIAPGVCIKSTWKGGGYNTISGTSMASPHAAGAAALYISTKATRPLPADVKIALQGSGNLNWFTGTDPDGSPDTLINVASF